MRLTIGATMTNGEIGSAARHMTNLLEVVHTILVGNILLATQDIDDAGVDILQFRLVGHRHTTDSLIAVAVLEETAVADHQRLDTWVGTVVERLQTTARHASHTDILHVNLVIIR